MLQEFRYALRMIVHNPGFTAIAVLSLALGIGANAAIFSIADALLLRPLPVKNPDSVLEVDTDTASGQPGGVSYPDYRDLRASAKSFDGMAAFEYVTVSMARAAAETPRIRMGSMVSDNFFSVMGVHPFLGREFVAEENARGGNPAAVLAYPFWRDQFGGDPSIVGKTVRISGVDFNVVGVLPKKFTSMDVYVRPAFYVPLQVEQRISLTAKDPLEDRNNYGLTVEGRSKRGVSQKQAQSEMTALWKGLQQQYPSDDRVRTMQVRTQLQIRVAQDSLDAILLTMLMVLVSVVLLIACANVANLLLGRARGRSREIAVRIALGVSRTRLMRQLFAENILLALLGAAVGIGFAYLGIRFLQNIPIPTDLPIVIDPQLNQRVLVFSLLAALASALVFGLAPAIQSFKTQVVSALKNAETDMSRPRRTLGRSTLVIAQISLSMVLLVAAGMLVDGFHKLLGASPGFRTDHIMLSEFNTSLVLYTPEKTRLFYRDLIDRARAVPGVKSASLSAVVPFEPMQMSRDVFPDGYQLPKGEPTISVSYDVVDEKYFDLMKIAIVSGRAFTLDDKADTTRVAIVNQEFANRFWPGQDPLGKRFHLDTQNGLYVQVVGVACNSKYGFIGEPLTRYFYLPFVQEQKTGMILLTEALGDPATLAAPIRQIAHSLDVNQPMFNVRTFSNFYEMRMSPLKMVMQIVVTMGLMGLTLALIGTYGLVSYSVARRTREIGVRIAIGADRYDVIRMVMRQGFLLALIGIVVGGALSAAAGKALVAGLIGLATMNPATFIVVPVAVLLVTMAACFAPAWRASRVDPIRALRFE